MRRIGHLSVVLVVCIAFCAVPVHGAVIGGYPMPSLDDERRTYDRFGWSRTASDEPSSQFSAAEPGYSVGAIDIHGDTEADDLWTYVVQFQRTGLPGYRDRMNVWATYVRNGTYLADLNSEDAPHFADHSYVSGAFAYYEATGDTTLRTAAFNICNVIEALWRPDENGGSGQWASKNPGSAINPFAGRGFARNWLVLARCYEHDSATYGSTFIHLTNIWVQASNFLTFGPSGGGFYYDELLTDTVCGAGRFAAGDRVQAAFWMGLWGEAAFHAYRVLPAAQVTLRNQVRAKIVALGRFVRDYGLNTSVSPPNSFTYFGVNISTGARVSCQSSQYSTIALTNLLVFAAWFSQSTVEQDALMVRAKEQLDYGTRYFDGTPQGQVSHFLDSTKDSATGNKFLGYNKGELQYAWAIMAPFPSATARSTTTVQTSVLGAAFRGIAAGAWTAVRPKPSGMGAALGATGSSGHRLGFATTGVYDPGLRRVHFLGSDHPDPSSHMEYDEAGNTWSAALSNGLGGGVQHGYDHTAIDPKKRRLYHRFFGGAGANTGWCTIVTTSGCNGAWNAVSVPYPGDPSGWGTDFVEWRGTEGTWVLHGAATVQEFDPITGGSSDIGTIADGAAFVGCTVGAPHICYVEGEAASLWTFGKTGGLTARATPPCAVGDAGGGSSGALPFVDPVTGTLLHICPNNTMHAFTLAGGWSQISGETPPQAFSSGPWANSAMAIVVPDYGGIIVVATVNGGTTDAVFDMWVFKYAELLPQGLEPAAGGGTPPTAPTGLQVQ